VSPEQRKRTAGGKGKGARSEGRRRLSLAGFGGLVVVLFLVFAVAQGIGQPSVPEGEVAIVEDVPEEIGSVTTEEFDRALEQAAARSGQQQPPEPGNPQYEELKMTALGFLLDTVWLQGQAEEMGIGVSQQDVQSELRQIRNQEFQSAQEYRDFLEESKFTQEDVEEQVRLQLLSDEIQQRVIAGASQVSPGRVEAYYEAAQEQFTTPASRDVRLILNENRQRVEQANQQLQQDDSDQAWNRVARRFSTDEASKDNGGLREGLSEGLVEEPLNSRVFAAAQGEIVGPVKTPIGWYVFQVEEITPEDVQPLDQVRDQIRSQLAQQEQQGAFEGFIDDYFSKWQARTFCADGYVIDRCSNFKGEARPPDAPPACYRANPRNEPEACPAAVRQLVPALPGTVSLLVPTGEQLPQRPRPAGLGEAPEAGLPGGIPGGALPPGAAPAP